MTHLIFLPHQKYRNDDQKCQKCSQSTLAKVTVGKSERVLNDILSSMLSDILGNSSFFLQCCSQPIVIF